MSQTSRRDGNGWTELNRQARVRRVVRLSSLTLFVQVVLGVGLSFFVGPWVAAIIAVVTWLIMTIALAQFVNHPADGNLRATVKWLTIVAVCGVVLFAVILVASNGSS